MNDAGVVLVPLPNRECRRLHMPRNRLRIALSQRHTSTTILVYTEMFARLPQPGVRAAPTLRCCVPLMAAECIALEPTYEPVSAHLSMCAPRAYHFAPVCRLS